METQYVILTAESSDELMKSVNAALAQGWQLNGGVSISLCVDANDGIHHVVCAQSLTRIS